MGDEVLVILQGGENINLAVKRDTETVLSNIVSWLMVHLQSKGHLLDSIYLAHNKDKNLTESTLRLKDFITEGSKEIKFSFDIQSNKSLALNRTTNLYPKQQSIANELFKTTLLVLETSTTDIAKQFNNVEYLICVPPQHNLVNQTKQRMESLGMEPHVIMYLENGSHKVKMEKVYLRVVSYPKTLFIIVADECHWGIQKGSANDNFINNEILCKAKNVVTICVSATPFNILTQNSRILFRMKLLEDFDEKIQKGDIFHVTSKNSDFWEGYIQTDPHRIIKLPTMFLCKQKNLTIVNWMKNDKIEVNGLELSKDKIKYHRLEYFFRSVSESFNGNLEEAPIRTEDRFTELLQVIKKEEIPAHLLTIGEYVISILFYKFIVLDNNFNQFIKEISRIKNWCDIKDSSTNHKFNPKFFMQLYKVMIYIINDWKENEETDDLKEIFRRKKLQKDKNGNYFYCFTETDRIIHRLLDHSKSPVMIVVRMQPMEFAQDFVASLRIIRDICEWKKDPKFAVLFSSHKNELIKSNEILLQPLINEAKKHANEYNRKNDEKIKPILTFEQLTMPCILIVLQKGKLGDTFPSSFYCYDLRNRYIESVSSLSLSSLIQTLGRMCKYSQKGEIPYSLISKLLYNQIKKTVNTYELDNSNFDSSIDCVYNINLQVDDKIESSLSKQIYSKYKTFSGVTKPKSNSYDHQSNLIHKRRIILQAEPQVGKTLSFLWYIELLRTLICLPTENIDFNDNKQIKKEKKVDNTKQISSSNISYPYWKKFQNIEPYNCISFTKYHVEMLNRRLNWIIESGEGNNWLKNYIMKINEFEFIKSREGIQILNDFLQRNKLLSNPIHINDLNEISLVDNSSFSNLSLLLNWDGRFDHIKEFKSLNLENYSTTNQLNKSFIDDSFKSNRKRKMPPIPESTFQYRTLSPCIPQILPKNKNKNKIETDQPSTDYFLKLNKASNKTPFAFPIEETIISIPTQLNHFKDINSKEDLFVFDNNDIIIKLNSNFLHQINNLDQFPIFSPSYLGNVKGKQIYVDYSNSFPMNEERVHFIFIHKEEWNHYKTICGNKKILIQIPNEITKPLKNQIFRLSNCGIGFVRLFIQILAFIWKINFIWMLDDNILYTCEHAQNKNPKPCKLNEPMNFIEKLLQNRNFSQSFIETLQKKNYIKIPSNGFASKENKNQISSPPSNLFEFMGNPSTEFGVIGFARNSIQLKSSNNHSLWDFTANFSSFLFINIKSTCNKGVYFPPKDIWEEIDFNRFCHNNQLACFKCNLFFYSKAHSSFTSNNFSVFNQLKEQSNIYIWNNCTQVSNVNSPKSNIITTDSFQLISIWFKSRNISSITTSIIESKNNNFLQLVSDLELTTTTKFSTDTSIFCSLRYFFDTLSPFIAEANRIYCVLLLDETFIGYGLELLENNYFKPIGKKLKKQLVDFNISSVHLPSKYSEIFISSNSVHSKLIFVELKFISIDTELSY